MKKLFLLPLIILVFGLKAQVSIQWEALPTQLLGSANVLAQSKQGILFAFNAEVEKIFIKKPSEINWQTANFNDPPYHFDVYSDRFPQDEKGNIYFFDDEKLYKFEETSNSFTLILGGKLAYITDVAFANNRIYVLEYNQLKIFDANNYALLNTSKVTYDGLLSLMIGKNGNNYIVSQYGLDGFYLNSFNNEGTVLKEKVGVFPKGFRHRAYMLASGKILNLRYNELVLSDDGGKNWKALIAPFDVNSIKFTHNVNEQNEISLTTADKIYYSKDEGKSWKSVALPKSISADEYSIFLNENNIFVGLDGCPEKGTLNSKNQGKTWTKVETPPVPYSKGFLLNDDKDLFSKSCQYFDEYKTVNSNIWNPLSINGQSTIERLIFLKSGKWLAYNSKDKTYYVSADKGKSWQKQERFPRGIVNPLIFQNQLEELVIFDTEKYYVSNDEGLSWKENEAQGLDFEDFTFRKIIMIDNHIFSEINIDNANYVLHYDATEKTTSYLSDKNNVPIKNVVLNTISLLNNKNLCFIAPSTNGGSLGMFLYLTKDFGKTYEQKKLPIKTTACYLTFNDNNTLIITSAYSIYISYDLGGTWLEVQGNLPKKILNTVALDKDDYLYVAVKGMPIFKSKHQIENFKKMEILVYADVNKNNQKEPNEPIIPDLKLKNNIGNGGIKITNQSGIVESFAYGGTYNITPIVDSDLFIPNKTVYSITIDKNTDIAKLEIPIQIIQIDSCAKLKLSFTMPMIRRCFDNVIDMTVYNESVFNAFETKVTIELDTFMILQNVSPFQVSVLSHIGRKVILGLGTIKGRGAMHFRIQYKLDCKAALGAEHCVKATPSAFNECLDDNRVTKTHIECQKNIGSYDPNDKAAFVNGRKDATKIKAKQTLEYLIRFQNTGTDTAFNIVIKDPISRNLNIESIEPLIASHRYTWEVKDNTLFFHFKNIMLPDSNVNEKLSHGFIKFSIQPKSTLSYDDIVSNTAGIYFDFNDPILTNEVILNQKTTSNKDLTTNSITFKLFPNPVRDILYISLEEGNIQRTSIYSIEGRMMLTQKNTDNSIVVEHLPTGIYLLQIQTEKGVRTARFIKE